jgi:CheY-like chemotaxis protein
MRMGLPDSVERRRASEDEKMDPAVPRRLSVLIVDDIEEIRRLYAQYFGVHGIAVTTASDGVQALAAVLRGRPDVIVLDMSLPKLSGWEMLEKLRADPQTRGIPVIVLTGCLFPGSQSDAYRAGADSYLIKPCAPDVLLTEIIRLTGGPAPSQA